MNELLVDTPAYRPSNKIQPRSATGYARWASVTTASTSPTASSAPTGTAPVSGFRAGRLPSGRHTRGDEARTGSPGRRPDARDILDELTKRNVKRPGGSIHDPTDPVGRLPFNVLAMVAEFEADLIRMRTREGMKSPKPTAGRAASSRS